MNTTLTIRDTIIVGNTGGDLVKNVGSSITRQGVNFIGDNGGIAEFPIGNPNVNGDLVGVGIVPLLAPLGDYGGSTPSIPPLPGSPALDAAGPSNPGGTDQRGATRFINGALDIGAVEVQPTVVTTTEDEDSLFPGLGLSLREAIDFAAPDATITFAASLDGQVIMGAGSQLLIDNDLNIDASALPNGITISGDGTHSIFFCSLGQTISLKGMTIRDGKAARGGGINNNASLTLDKVTLVDNDATYGAGIYNKGTLTLNHVTLSQNHSVREGGALFNNVPGIATLKQCTVSGNSAGTAGGGLMNTNNSTIVLENSVVAKNSAVTGMADIWKVNGTVTPLGTNLIGDNESVVSDFPTGNPNVNGDLVGTLGAEIDPLLAPIGDNGGPTDTMLPLPGSPAIDAAGTSDPGGTDQRGAPRFRNGALDIGAVEVQPSPVTTVQDELDNPSSGGTGISLREAIRDASPGETITFDAALDGQPPITLTTGQLTISKNLTIDASALPGGITISGNNASRIFSITAGTTVAIDNLSLTSGTSALGGAIENRGILSLNNTSITLSSSTNRGGAIYNLPATAQLTITNSTLSGNSATSIGGAICSEGTLTLINSTLAGNTSTGNGGGAIFNFSQPLTLINCTVTGNTGFSSGGGIGNQGGLINLENSIISGNTAPSGPDISGTVSNATGVNFIGDPNGTSGLGTVGIDYLTGALLLAPLADNGGSTQTMMLLPGSPAIDAAGATALLTDQRGFERVLGSGPDIGAYEAAAGSYNADGLTLFAKVDAALTGAGMVFEISSDPNFLATASTLAGTGTAGTTDGPRGSAQFSYPSGVAQDVAGSLFIADTANNQIRMMSLEGEVSTIAGTGEYGFTNGPGATATFKFPSAILVGSDNHVYVSDLFNHCIRKLTRPAVVGQQWTVTTLAGNGLSGFLDGAGSVARFSQPRGLAQDGDGNLYVADSLNHRIRKVTPSGVVSTFAGSGVVGSGDGFPDDAQFNMPFGLVFDSLGNLFVADRDNHLIRRIDSASGVVSSLAGQASVPGFEEGTSGASFDQPIALAVDDADNLYVADENNHSIRKVTAAGVVSNEVGTGVSGFENGNATVAQFHCPTDLLVDLQGDLIVADSQNHVLRRITIKPLQVTAAVAPGGENVSAILDAAALGLSPNQTYYVRWRSLFDQSTQMLGQSFFLVEAPTVVTEAADNLTSTTARLNATVNPNNSPTEVLFEYSTDPDLTDPLQVGTYVGTAPAVGGPMISPRGLVRNAPLTYVADRGDHLIRLFGASGSYAGRVGEGPAGFVNGALLSARFDHPSGLAYDGDDNILYVADEFNHRIRRIDFNTQQVSTFAGSGVAGHADGPGATARFLYPTGLAIDSTGNLFVADSGNHRIRKITPAGEVTTVAGTGVAGFTDGAGGAAQFDTPLAVAVSSADSLYVADTGNHSIRSITAGNSVLTLAGNGTAGFQDGAGTAARFSSPTGLTIDGDNLIFVTDRDNHRIRRVTTGGEVGTFAGSGVDGLLDSPVGELHPATATEFGFPAGIAADSGGDLYISEAGNATIRRITRTPLPSVLVTPDITGRGEQLASADLPEPLLPGGTYYFRAIGTNGRNAPIAGEILSFVTPESEIVIHNGSSTAAPLVNPGQEIDFGTTPFNIPVLRTFTIENIGNFELEITGVAITGSPSGAFALSGSTGASTIPAGGSINFEVTLQSGVAATYLDEIVITSSDLDEDTITFSVSGEALAPPVLSGVTATDVTATGVAFSATINPTGSPTEVAFEFSKFEDFEGALEVLTKAGSDQGFANGCGIGAKFDSPSDVAVDRFGNVYVADTGNHRIRKITPDGDCNVLAGSGVAGFADGSSNQAQFNAPEGIAIDPFGNVYVADTLNHRIRRITPEGSVTTLAGTGTAAFTDGIASAARFNLPTGIALDANRDLYIADSGNNRVRKIDTAGEVSTVAGPTEFDSPQDVAVDSNGNVFVADRNNHRIAKVTPAGTTTTLLGVGPESSGPTGVAVDSAGNVYAADRGRHSIVRFDTANQFTVLAGLQDQAGSNDGSGTDARFDSPAGLTVSSSGTIFVADRDNHRVRQINLAARTVVAATGLTGTAPLIPPVEVNIGGLDPDTIYFYRAIGTNGGGTAFSPTTSPYPTFTTLDNAAGLMGLTVNGIELEGFDPCSYSYPLEVAPLVAALVITATAESSNATIQVLEKGVLCCELVSGVPSAPIPIGADTNQLQVAVISADQSAVRTYTVNISRLDDPFAQWQIDNFGSDAGNPVIAGALADPDFDEFFNLLEYAFDLDPNLVSIDGVPVVGRSGGFLSITYRRLLAPGGIVYRVEWSTDLASWSDVGVSEDFPPGESTGLTEVVRGSIPDPERRKFIRVTIIQP